MPMPRATFYCCPDKIGCGKASEIAIFTCRTLHAKLCDSRPTEAGMSGGFGQTRIFLRSIGFGLS
jgi:hypothetical protein